MSGMINGSSGVQASAEGGLSNPLLQQAEAKIESNLTPENRANYMKIVVSGLSIALQGGPDGPMAKLRNVPDPIGACAKGAVALVLIMRKQSRGVMPMKAMIPAGMTLMFHALDFIDRARIAKVAEPEIDRASTTFVNFLFHKLGIGPGMLQQMAGKVHGLMSDPASMQAIQMKAGLLRHPMAATPTPLPGGLMNGGGAGD